MALNSEDMREIYQGTVIVRKPTYGIVKGYHELPYICLGAALESGFGTTLVKGKIQVSPQFVIRPKNYWPSYEEIFGEDNVDDALTGRIFGFMGFSQKPIECKSEYLEVAHLRENIDQALSDSMDDLERREDITTGIIITPNSQYYPISIERFIATVLDDEFSL